ncbi:ABC transporter ATP-binding protein [Vibrio diazotrophicus]|jgi:multiple sugar transport system ATP-binding protein|uniref:ABC transporter ATP-binding protein n=1 Tax=Vibrio diazotrophicus TaxID=685 RepID=UPI000C9DC278|nr:sn-glycerol-3-phosphate ABC transporter ATP-binding protein UgpC [Vibrio diazotrophicus]PNH78256.1 ABC transporter ATP-binding protein [Vibrio diazotrophicus]PNH97096.1 ABC transporter ATP-binding protein [Vibrio diazotrophicus]
MAASIEIKNLTKAYNGSMVLNDISFHIKEREFIVFLGPSGCGKSTLLRMIAGLENLSDGEIWMDGKRLDTLAPGHRNISMVFQNYALYPHMSVEENMTFGLKNIGTEKSVIKQRLSEAARILEIEHLLNRKPAELSGGQRQRVAIGRAIVREPSAFLFDEPLSNLDAALRSRTRIELAQLHQRVNTTMIYVTHDQVEAMTLADRIVILNNKGIEQIGTPIEIYQRPASKFVAGFVGSPAMNFFDVDKVEELNGKAVIHIDQFAAIHSTINTHRLPLGQRFEMGIRAEDIVITENDVPAHATGKITFIERLGDRTLVYVSLESGKMLIAEASSKRHLQTNQHVGLNIDFDSVHLFDESEKAYHGGEL